MISNQSNRSMSATYVFLSVVVIGARGCQGMRPGAGGVLFGCFPSAAVCVFVSTVHSPQPEGPAEQLRSHYVDAL